MMLKLYLYGYSTRVQSSRRLEREAARNTELMWLTGKLCPDFKTIADSRRDNPQAITAACRQYVVLCRELGLLGARVVAVDGSKFKGVNNRDRNHTRARYMDATFPPGLRTGVHAHAGPEAWYVLSGTQCLQTPDRTIIARAGEGALVPQGPPMVLSSIGKTIRRSVLLVLHDSSMPWTAPASGWQPAGPCDPSAAQ